MKGVIIPMKKLSKFRNCGELQTTITGKLLYFILDDLADDNGEIIIPQRRIADTLHISKGTVSRNLRRLRDKDYIGIQAQYRSEDGGRSANKYTVN
jgi:DNA-binding MarR family transcriptional regulator